MHGVVVGLGVEVWRRRHGPYHRVEVGGVVPRWLDSSLIDNI